MCRFVAHLGNNILLRQILVDPENSLLEQSFNAKEAPEPTNGDGFGLAWYKHKISPNPGLYTSIFPAWNDSNLIHLAKKITSPCFLAHVRKATIGSLSQANCHPFIDGNLALMHNGTIGDFIHIKRHLRHLLDDDHYAKVHGESDSEHFFGLLLQLASDVEQPFNSQNLTQLLRDTLDRTFALSREFGNGDDSFLNICLTNGHCLVASRVTNSESMDARSLYYHIDEGQADHPGRSVLVSSEKLDSYTGTWTAIEQNHLITVDESLNISLESYTGHLD